MPSASLTLRNTKGSALSFTEMDNNLTSLAAAANASASTSSLTTIDANLGTATTNITTIDANIGSYQTYANATFAGDTFNSGALYDLGAYVPIKYTGGAILANVGQGHYWSDVNYQGALFGTITSTSSPASWTSGEFLGLLGVATTGSPAGNVYNDNPQVIVPSVRDLPLTANNSNWTTPFNDTWGNVHIFAREDNRYEFSNVALKLPTDTTLTNAVLLQTQETLVANGNTSGTISINGDNGSIQTFTLTGGITLNAANFSNMGAGQTVSLILTQDGTGSHTLTSDLKYSGGNKTLSTAANSIDTLTVTYDGTNYLAALVTGYA